jgi:ribosomal protein S3
MGQKTNSTIFSLSTKKAEWKSKYIEKNVEESSVLLFQDVEIRNYLNRIFKVYGFLVHSCKIEYNHGNVIFLINLYNKKSETEKFYKEESKEKLSLTKFYNNFSITNSKELISFIVNNILVVDLSLFLKNKAISIKTHNLNKKLQLLIKSTKTNFFEYKKVLKNFKRFLKNPIFKELLKISFIAITERNSAKLVAEAISSYYTKQKKRHGFVLFFIKKTFSSLIPLKMSQIKGIKIVITGRFNGAPRSNKKIIKAGSVPLQSFKSNISYYEDTAYTSNGTFGIKVWICENDNNNT